MTAHRLDHVVIHIDDWERCNWFYEAVLGASLVANPEGEGNPVGGVVAYRFGEQQVNVHGPWPGRTDPCCLPPLDEVGRSDVAFATDATSTEIVGRLRELGVEIVDGPVARFGARGWGTSVYCRDPSGNGVEIISYE